MNLVQRKKNYDYILQKITNKNTQLQYSKLFNEFEQNSFTQSINYNFTNHNQQLIKNSFQDTPKHKNNIHNNIQNIQSKKPLHKKTNTLITSQDKFTLLEKEFECYSLHQDLQNNFVACVLFCISSTFRMLNIKQQKEYIKTLQYKMYLDLTEKNIFQSLEYKSKVSKSHLESQLTNYHTMNQWGHRYLMDYFNLNVLVMNYNTKQISPYLQWHTNNNRKKIVFAIKITKPVIFCPMISDEELIESIDETQIDCSNCFSLHFIKKLKSVSSYKLLDLQKMCKELQISLTKIVNGKDKKKTKKDLHQELSNYINS